MNSTYKCRGCKDRFKSPCRLIINGGTFHDMNCAVTYAQATSAKLKATKEKKAHTKAKRELKNNDRSFQLKKTQGIFNGYIRLRDSDLPCISCRRHHTGQYHAGHYKTVGANPELRFHPDNCHKQCSACNNHLSGNIVNFRIGLVGKIGAEGLDFIEGPHPAKKYTIAQLKVLQRWFTRKTKRLIKENESC